MMHATAGRSAVSLGPKAIRGFDASPDVEGGAGPLGSLSQIPTAAPIRRKCSTCANDDDASMGISPKLEIGAVDHPAEREADAVADRVMAGGNAGVTSAPAQSATSGPIRAKSQGSASGASGGTMAVGGAQASAIGGLGGGNAMPASDRSFFEPRMGQDLSHVRLHRGPQAESAAASIGARAFTQGNNIVLGKGEYGSDHSSRHLMAHELAHVHQNDGVLRMKCASPVKACDAQKLATAEKKIAGKKLPYKDWEFRQTTSGCYLPEDTAKAIKKTKSDLFTGSVQNYKNVVINANDIKVKKEKGKDDKLIIGVDKCFGYPVGWVDPKIGDANEQIESINKAGNEAEKYRIIAAIYGEQSLENETGIKAAEKAWDDHDAKYSAEKDEAKKLKLLRGFQALHTDLQIAKRFDIQRQYIFYAMLLRIEGFEADWGPTFADVVIPKTFHSLKPKKTGTHENNYKPAVQYLKGNKPTKAKPVNTAAINRFKDVVTNAKKSNIPRDAGPYYFHWWKKVPGTGKLTTVERKYQKFLKSEDTADQAEKKAAHYHAKNVVGATMSGISEAQGWLRRIDGPNYGTADAREGSMYIFR